MVTQGDWRRCHPGGHSASSLELECVLANDCRATIAEWPEDRTLGELLDVRLSRQNGLSFEWAEAVRGLTGGRGVDRVVEVGGPGTLAQSIKAATHGGEISLVGALASGGSPIDFMSVFMNQVTLRSISVGSRSDMEAMLRAVDGHAMHPVIDRVFSFAEAKAAWAYYAAGTVFGKVVIRH